MDYFPLFARVKGRKCLLVGAGDVAARKARSLTKSGAVLQVVAPQACQAIQRQAAAGELRFSQQAYDSRFLDGAYLVIAATSSPLVNATVFRDAEERQIFCNSVDDLASSSVIVPAIVDRSPLVVAISSAGTAPVLARRWREKLEALLPANLGTLARFAGQRRKKVARVLSDIVARRRFWERYFVSASAQRLVSGDATHAAQDFTTALQSASVGRTDREPGEAWLVGAGPGDPGLLTLRALQLMQQADVVLYDRLVGADVLELVRRDAQRIAVGKKPGEPCMEQEEICDLLVRLVADGHRVCRLKGGDPFVFGRGGEEVQALQEAGLRYQIVPGITAAAGCAAYSGIPLTHRDHAQSVVLVTAHGRESIDRLDWRSLARDRQTLAFYMGVARLDDIRKNLLEHGRSASTPFALVENGTTSEQRVISGELGTLVEVAKRHAVRAPAMLYIGEVASFAGKLEWFRPSTDTKRLAPEGRIVSA